VEKLPNGMTVIYHPDHTVPTVVVNVSYNVGSRNEIAGRTGFAHLFEHLMFMGTKRAPTKMFDAWMESAGGWNNAWTSEDRTDYFDVGPPSALDLLLWLEADRMRDIGPLMTREKLDAQRDVVKNERRQSYENRPYGKADLRLTELLYPPEHPYHHPVIGSHADLTAAEVVDVKAFFAKWYDPANASLVVAGDFDPAAIRPIVNARFGSIPSQGKPADVSRAAATGKRISAPVTETLTDDVELPRVTLAWASPAHFAAGDAELDLLGTILGDGKSSRLFRTLVFEKKLAQAVNAHQASSVLESHFEVEVMLKPGVPFEKVEAAVVAELAAIAKSGPSAAELQRAQAGYEAAFVKRLEAVRERASILNLYQAEMGRPDYAREDLERYRKATVDGVKDAWNKVAGNPLVTLRVSPEKKNEKATSKGGDQ
jgi:predicted Zn-dependent peptidase